MMPTTIAAHPNLAHPGPWHDGGPGWWILVPIAIWTVVSTAAVLWWRRRTPSAQTVLAEAFARGDVSEQEYRARLAVLRETRRR